MGILSNIHPLNDCNKLLSTYQKTKTKKSNKSVNVKYVVVVIVVTCCFANAPVSINFTSQTICYSHFKLP